jgi:hypothetical protein
MRATVVLMMIGAECHPEFGIEEFPRRGEAVVCRHRGNKRIGFMLETTDKNVHERFPVSRSLFGVPTDIPRRSHPDSSRP